jgi:signal transduction histidine kinase
VSVWTRATLNLCTFRAHPSDHRFCQRTLVAGHDLLYRRGWDNLRMRWRMIGRVGVIAALFGSVVLVVAGEQSMASAGRPWLAGLERAAPIALVIGSVLLVAVPRAALAAVGALTALASAAFVFVGRQGPIEGPGMLAVALMVSLLFLSVVLLEPAASPRSWWVLSGIAGVAAVGVVRTVVYDPFADPDCVGLCRRNPILVTTDLELADMLGRIGAAGVVALAVVVVWRVIGSKPGPTGGSHRWLVIWCVGVAAVVVGSDAAVRLASGAVTVPSHVTAGGLTATLAAASLVSVALIATAYDPLRARRDVGRVSRLLERAEQESDVQTIFRRALGDDDLRVGYWVDGAGYIDRDGAPVTSSGRTQVELTTRGSPMAVVVPGRAAPWPQLVSEQLGAHARLAIHNESLALELNRRVEEVARSRTRIVEVGDAERRRLERDLHDGAQQRLLALSFELRRGQHAAVAVHDEQAASTFMSAYGLAQTALDQLRHLAHGIHPATLSGAGLQEAVAEFADSSGSDTAIDIEITGPLPEPIEAAIYRIVTATIAATANGTAPHFGVRRAGQSICVAISGVAELPQHAIDRAAAIGGTYATTSTGVEVALPCGS